MAASGKQKSRPPPVVFLYLYIRRAFGPWRITGINPLESSLLLSQILLARPGGGGATYRMRQGGSPDVVTHAKKLSKCSLI